MCKEQKNKQHISHLIKLCAESMKESDLFFYLPLHFVVVTINCQYHECSLQKRFHGGFMVVLSVRLRLNLY